MEISQFLAWLHTFHLVARVVVHAFHLRMVEGVPSSYEEKKFDFLHSHLSKTLTLLVCRFRVEG